MADKKQAPGEVHLDLMKTDAPYLTTQEGKVDNIPHYIGDGASLVAKIRQTPMDEVVTKANSNMLSVWDLVDCVRAGS